MTVFEKSKLLNKFVNVVTTPVCDDAMTTTVYFAGETGGKDEPFNKQHPIPC